MRCGGAGRVRHASDGGGRRGMISYMHLEARHAHLKSILGIDDAVLADTNRFVLGDGNYSQSAQWSTGFGIIQH